MPTVFPSEEWLTGLEAKLNSDQRYAEIAKNWEGDLLFLIEPEGNLTTRGKPEGPPYVLSGPLAWRLPKSSLQPSA